MNIGITFGGYCPLHRGHLDLIMRAKKENERCYIVVCGYDNEPRAKEMGASLDERVRLIRDFFDQDEQIRVIGVDDTVLGIDESMSDCNWRVWQKEIHRQCGEELLGATCTWYVAEPQYKEALERVNVLEARVVLAEKINRISAMEIRRQPRQYWNLIARPFRQFFTANVLVTGTASEGKSTLVRDVARYYDLPYVEEYARTYMQLNNKTDLTLNADDYEAFLVEQNRLCKEAQRSPANRGCIIADTDNVVTLMYAISAAEDPQMNVSLKDYEERLLPLAKRLAPTLCWQKIFLLEPHSAYIDDGFRYMGHSSMSFRNRQLDTLLRLIGDWGMLDNVVLLKGSMAENYISVRDYIGKLLYETEKDFI